MAHENVSNKWYRKCVPLSFSQCICIHVHCRFGAIISISVCIMCESQDIFYSSIQNWLKHYIPYVKIYC